jgi:hypothetical protein
VRGRGVARRSVRHRERRRSTQRQLQIVEVGRVDKQA